MKSFLFFCFLSMLFAMDIQKVLHFMQENQDNLHNILQEAIDQEIRLRQEKAEIIEVLQNVPLLSRNIHMTYDYIQRYDRVFGHAPPDALMDPLYDAAKSCGDFAYIWNLDALLHPLKKEDKFVSGQWTLEQSQEMERLLDKFKVSPEPFQTEIDEMYPLDESRDLDKALREVAKMNLLIQRWVEEHIEKDKDVLFKAFQDTDLRDKVFTHRLTFFLDLYNVNLMNRLIIRARSEQNHSKVVQIYQLIRESYQGMMKDMLPDWVVKKLLVINPDERTRHFLQWKLMDIVGVKQAHHSEYLPKSLIRLPAMYNKINGQMLHALSPFLNLEEKLGNPDETFQVIREFRKIVKPEAFKPNTSAKIINNLFWRKIKDEIPNHIRRNSEKFGVFAPLTENELKELLEPNKIQPDQVEQIVLDFFSADNDLLASNGQPKANSKRKRKSDKRKAKREAKKSNEALAGEQEEETMTVPGEISTIDKPSENEKEESFGKSPIHGEKEAQKEVEVHSFVDEDVSGSPFVDGSEIVSLDVQREIDEQMEAHMIMVAQFKAMKKATQVNYSRKAIIGHVEKMNIEKAKVVAFLPTDEICVLHTEANNVYLDNESMKTGEYIANRNGAFKFEWVFNPSVFIDRSVYLFLCQVFHVVKGNDRLNFDNFIKAYVALTQEKKSSSKAARKSANRTVFQFNHVIETESTIYVPPIAGVHPEHKSSRFNLSQVAKFLTHGGAHPYFFKLIRE